MKNAINIMLICLLLGCKYDEKNKNNDSELPSFIQIEQVDSNYLVIANNYLLEKYNDSIVDYIFGHYYVFEEVSRTSYYDTTRIHLIVRTSLKERYEFQFDAGINTAFSYIFKDNDILLVNTDFPNLPGAQLTPE